MLKREWLDPWYFYLWDFMFSPALKNSTWFEDTSHKSTNKQGMCATDLFAFQRPTLLVPDSSQ